MACPPTYTYPLFAASFSVAVILSSVALAKAHGHIPAAIRTPPISLAGIHAPEYYLFAPGFTLMALALAQCEAVFFTAFAAHLPLRGADAEVARLQSARGLARLGFAGLAAVGLVPLQGWGGAATLLHVLGSLAFFAFSLHHGHAMTSALASDALARHPLHRSRAPGLWWGKVALLCNGLLSALPAQLLHPGGTPTSPHPGGAEAAELDAGGFSQWWLVGSLIGYYTLFAGDLAVLAAAAAAAAAAGTGARGGGERAEAAAAAPAGKEE